MTNRTVVTINIRDFKAIHKNQKDLEETLRVIKELKEKNPDVEFHIEVSNFTILC